MAEPPPDLDIIVTGFEVDRQQAEAGLMRVFGLDAQRARSFLEQLPIVAKRCNELEAAERYAHALRSIGARIEVRPHLAASPPAPLGRSLPPPTARELDQLRESVRHTSASERAIARFRAAEGLENPASSNAPPGSIDLYNPVIPKAPALPRDLKQMPNGPRSLKPERSERAPEWMISDPLALTPERDGDTPTSLRSLESEALRTTRRSSSKPTSRPASERPASERLSDRPRSVGIAHAATASVRPGLSAVSRDAPRPNTRRQLLKLGIALAFGGAIAVIVLRWNGYLLSDDERYVRAWRREGIEAGEHALVRAWLGGAGHHLHGLDPVAADRLLDQLERAGATTVFAARISGPTGHQEASAVVVELPADKVSRRTILWHLAGARGESAAPLSDDGQRFELLELR